MQRNDRDVEPSAAASTTSRIAAHGAPPARRQRLAWVIPLVAATAFAVGALSCASDYGATFDSQVWFPFGDQQLAYVLGSGGRPGTRHVPAFEANGPLAGVLAAATNKLLHERLGIVDAILGRHVFIILCAAAMVGFTARLALDLFGVAPAVWSAALLAAHPRFFAEGQNNMSDVPAAAAATAAIVWFVRSVRETRPGSLLAAAVAAAAVGAIRFPNLVFLGLTLAGWLLVSRDARASGRRLLRRLGWNGAIGVSALFVGCLWLFRPLAWTAPLAEMRAVVDYFVLPARSGYSRGAVPVFYGGEVHIGGPPSYHIVLLLLTTPVPVLLAGIAGTFSCWRRARPAAALLFVWVVVILGRHVVLGLGNYGGVRHVVDVFPALAILAGVGADTAVGGLARWLGRRWNRLAAGIVWAVGFLTIVGSGVRAIVTLHPYPVVYYNALVGGLHGASRSFEAEYSGSAYREGLDWAARNLSDRDAVWVHRTTSDYLLARMQAHVLELGGPAILGGPPSRVAAGLSGLDGHLFTMQILRPGVRERAPRGLHLEDLPLVHEIARDGVPLLRIRRVPDELAALWRERAP